MSRVRRSTTASLMIAAAATLFSSAAAVPAFADPPAPSIRGANAVSAIPGSYIVMLKSTGSAAATDDARRSRDLSARYKGKIGAIYTHASHGFSAKMSEADAKKLATDPQVAYVEQDQYMVAAGVNSSTNQTNGAQTGQTIKPHTTQTVAETWGLDRIDQKKLPLDQKYHYDAALAGKGVTAYIISTGIRITHEDFGGRAIYGPNFVDDGHSTSDDCNGGGTGGAGYVGGAEFGVAKGVLLVAVRVFGCNGIGALSWIESAVDWVAANAVRPAVALLDLNVCVDPNNGGEVLCDPTEIASLVEAEENVVAAGVLVTMPAGDQNRDTCANTVGLAPNVVSVGATTIGDAKLQSSNFGGCVDMWAPGQGIRTDSATNDIGDLIGTGSAGSAAYVAGAAALLLSDPKFRTASPAQLTDQLVNKQSTKGVITGLDANSPNKLLFTNPPGSFTVASSVKMTANANGQLTLFGTNPGGFMLQRSQTGVASSVVRGSGAPAASSVTWGPWIQSATKGWDSAAAARNADGRIELIGLTQTHELWQRQQTAANASTWLTWSQLDTPSSLGLSAASVKLLQNNRLMMFGTDQDGNAYFRTQTAPNATTWGGWTRLSSPGQVRSISAESNTDGKVEIVVADTDGNVWRTKQISANDTNWSAFTQIPSGNLGMGFVSATHNADGRLDVFGTDFSGVPWHATQTSAGAATYSSWTALPAAGRLSSVTAEANSVGRIDVIAVDAAGNVWESVQNAVNTNSYASFSNIGGALRP